MHPPDDSEPSSNSEPLRPLTKKTVTGKLYTRPDKHKRDIRRALSVPVAEFESWIRAFGYAEHRYADLPDDAPSPEALVYLYRHYLSEVKRFERERRGRARVQVEHILAVLLEGIYAAVESHLAGKLKGVPSNRKSTCREEVLTTVLENLHDQGDAADPMEVAFGKVLKCECIKVSNHYRRRARTEREITTDKMPDYEDETPDLARLLDGERAIDMLEYLPPKQRLAVQRLILQPEPPTQADLAAEKGVSTRTIRNWLRGAEANLRKLLSEDN